MVHYAFDHLVQGNRIYLFFAILEQDGLFNCLSLVRQKADPGGEGLDLLLLTVSLFSLFQLKRGVRNFQTDKHLIY